MFSYAPPLPLPVTARISQNYNYARVHCSLLFSYIIPLPLHVTASIRQTYKCARVHCSLFFSYITPCHCQDQSNIQLCSTQLFYNLLLCTTTTTPFIASTSSTYTCAKLKCSILFFIVLLLTLPVIDNISPIENCAAL